MGGTGFRFDHVGIKNETLHLADTYSTRQGDFGAVTKTAATELTATATPAHLGTMVSAQFLAVICYDADGQIKAIVQGERGISFAWVHATKKLTIAGLAAWPDADYYDMLVSGAARPPVWSDGGLIINQTNQAIATYVGAVIPVQQAGKGRVTLAIEALTNCILRINARASAAQVGYVPATVAYLGVAGVTTAGLREISFPTGAYDIQVEYEVTAAPPPGGAGSAIKVYVSTLSA
jgi:hypothetical protein